MLRIYYSLRTILSFSTAKGSITTGDNPFSEEVRLDICLHVRYESSVRVTFMMEFLKVSWQASIIFIERDCHLDKLKLQEILTEYIFNFVNQYKSLINI